MKTFKYFIPLFALFLMSCIDEPAPDKTANEIVAEITKTWNCQEYEEGFPLNFEATITSDPSVDGGIIISNFHNSSQSVKAIVKADYTIEIPKQTIGGTQEFFGSGTIRENFASIYWDYTLVNDNGTVNITGTYTYGTTS